VLKNTIPIISRLRSPALLLFQVLYTCGIKVMDDNKEPRWPTISIFDILE
jgi:hypothetical protein